MIEGWDDHRYGVVGGGRGGGRNVPYCGDFKSRSERAKVNDIIRTFLLLRAGQVEASSDHGNASPEIGNVAHPRGVTRG
jgi:hypothetical protein